MSPQLSVVVPFYNVELYFAACLESLAAQTFQDMEIILVDDGSADGSLGIAERFAARDQRFRLVRQENQGLGPARNTGVRHATGAYLAFADSDDVIPPEAYTIMVASLEQTGSDLVCGGVRRIGVRGLEDSPLHKPIFEKTLRKTHVRSYPELLKDRTAWNKVFRRSFWDEHGFAFPPGLYEDAPVTVPAHILAGTVDVLRNPVYYWRTREAGRGPASITGRRTEIHNLEERMRSIERVRAFITARADDLTAEFDRSVLASDVRIYLRAFLSADEAWRARFADLVGDYLDRTPDGVVAGMPPLQRVTFHAVRERMFEELAEIARFTFTPGAARNARAVRRGLARRRWYAELPYLGDPRFPVHLYELSGEFDLDMAIEKIGWRDGRLRVEGRAYIRGVDAPDETDSRIEVEIRRRRPKRLPDVIRPAIERIHRPDVTEESRQSAASYDHSGFAFEVDPALLGTRGTKWHVFIKVRAQGVTREAPLGRPEGLALWAPGQEVAPGVRVAPRYEDDGERLLLLVHTMGPKLTAARLDGDAVVELSGRLPAKAGATAGGSAGSGGPGKDGGLFLQLKRNGTVLRFPATPDARAANGAGEAWGAGFTVRIPLAELADATEPLPRGADWDVKVIGAAKTEKNLAVETDLDGALRCVAGGRDFELARTRYGYLRIIERPVRPLVDAVTWQDGGALRLDGTWRKEPAEGYRPDAMVLRRRRSGDTHLAPVTWEGDRFTAVITPRRTSLAGTLPLIAGNWDLLMSGADGEVPVTVVRRLAESPATSRVHGVHELIARIYQTDRLQLRIVPALAPDERSAYARRRLTEEYHGTWPAAARAGQPRRPLADRIVFDSYFARQYSCNPQAIYEEIQRRNTGLECVWVTVDGQFAVPGDARIVLRDSRAYFEAVSSARFVVNNCMQPPGYRKREGQTYLQTWHGTPYKHIGYDLVEGDSIASDTIAEGRFEEDVPQWDHLLSPGPHVTGMFRRAFRYDGSVLEVGYPRNDLLFHPERARIAAETRARLGLPEGRRVVLYMPTWREDTAPTSSPEVDASLGMIKSGLPPEALVPDLDRIAAALGDDDVVLARWHHLGAGGMVGSGGSVVDVTEYPDVRHLYLIADVLITDYSSAMFDFAVTGRPQLLFTPDLEYYQERLRGGYFDLSAEAPGPTLRTTDETIDALRDLDAVAAAHSIGYKAFRERYCPIDDGTAAAKVVDRLLGL